MSDVTLQSLQAQINKLQKQVDDMDPRLAAVVENVNLLRGDEQRVAELTKPRRARRVAPGAVVEGA